MKFNGKQQIVLVVGLFYAIGLLILNVKSSNIPATIVWFVLLFLFFALRTKAKPD
jgi:putative effector of murein hydrolase LrgA (UPF0299 family)